MKLNKFKQINIPAPKEYFKRYGYQADASGSYTGDDARIPQNLDKVETIAAGEQLYQEKLDNHKKNIGNAQKNDVTIDPQNPAGVTDTTGAGE